MRNKRLSILMIMLLIFALVMPTASFASSEANSKVFTSKLGDVAYKFDMSKIEASKINRETDASKEEQMKQHKVEGTKGSMNIERNGAVQMSAQNAAQSVASKIEPQNYVPVSDSSKTISVIVELQAEPLAPFNAKVKQGLMKASVNQEAIITNEQASFKKAVSNLSTKITRTYSVVFNGFALEIAADKVDQLLKMPGVKAIYADDVMQATPIDILNANVGIMMDRSAPHIGADHFWNQGFTGQGIKVGVLDTGIDYLHPDLVGAYKGGWDFVNNDNDPYETTPGDHAKAPPGTPPVDSSGRTYWTDHGTHVAGIVAGRGVAPGGVKGVAPGADIYAYKVLGPYGSGATSGIIAAIERSVIDELDVINLSLGSQSNNQYSANSVALNNAMLAGVVVAVSAGNSGPNDGTLTDPATSELSISVGNSLPPTNVPSITADGFAAINGSMMAFSPELGNLVGQTLDMVYVGLGESSDFTGKDVRGKIALMQRGNISFQDKSLNAQRAGAAVAIVFNNAPGNFSGTLGDPGDYIPTFSLTQADGLLLKNRLDAVGSLTTQLGYALEIDYMNDSSSRGPARPGYDLKPDVAAPGTGIVSSVPAYGKEDPNADYSNAYEAFTGTSMAAPHVAGAAALLLQKYEGITQFDVKSLIMNNAYKISDRDGNRYRHMDAGAGRVDLVNATAAKAVVLVQESTDAFNPRVNTPYLTGSLSFGFLGAGDNATKTITVKDIVGEASSYSISTKWYGDAGGTITTSKSQVAVSANGTSDFTLNLRVPSNTTQKYYEGELVLTETNGHKLQLPIAVYVGAQVALDPVTDLELDPDIFSPYGEGIYDTTDITFNLNERAGYLTLDVFDWDAFWIGTVAEGSNLNPGSYIVEDWDGVVDFWGLDFPILLWDDIYLMVPFFSPDNSAERPVVDAITPFIVVTEAPETSLNDPDIVVDDATNTGVISGTIDSSLLLDLMDEGILLNTISEMFGAGVLYQENGKWVQIDGIVDDEGHFSIEVPLKEGENQFEVYVYDVAGNGVLEPNHIVNYYFEDKGGDEGVNIIAHPSANQVEVGTPFTVGIDFSNVHDLYAAQFSLTYDSSLNKGTVSPSAELSAYQSSNNSDQGLIVSEKVTDLGDGKERSDYIISLAGDFAGYTGTGSLATFNFSSDTIGEYNLALSHVRLLNSEGEDVELSNISGATVQVTDIVKPVYAISGNIVAEAFIAGTDYSKTWYEGEDGMHKIMVEALNEDGHVVALGAISADGSYTLTVDALGDYTIRAVVPGHFGSVEAVTVDGDMTVNFGPLTAGDVNGDGVIDLVDLQLIAKQFGKKANADGTWSDAKASAANITRSGEVDMMDISYILKNYGMRK